MNQKFYHSVYLQAERCVGCIHCLKRCPTEAIRVPNRKAEIIKEFCIDCSECILHCPQNAKRSRRDQLTDLDRYAYTVALVDPSIYGQFNHLHDTNILLTAVLNLGFDDVFEIAYAYEYMLEKTISYIRDNPKSLPLLGTTCPSVLRLIRVRFPELIPYLSPFLPPPEIAARAAVKLAQEKSGLPREKIGIVYIAPCPAQISFSKSPLGMKQTQIDVCLAMKDVYKPLLPLMKQAAKNPLPLARAGKLGVLLGAAFREARTIDEENVIAVDGIENVIKVLNDIEDDRFPDNMEYVELKGCHCGCVGGVLNVENPYIARAKNKMLERHAPDTHSSVSFFEEECGIDLMCPEKISYEPVYTLGSNMIESMQKMQQVEDILKTLPGLDCGSCGAPTCRTLAEDIVRNETRASKDQCIYYLRGKYYNMMREAENQEERNEPNDETD